MNVMYKFCYLKICKPLIVIENDFYRANNVSIAGTTELNIISPEPLNNTLSHDGKMQPLSVQASFSKYLDDPNNQGWNWTEPGFNQK